MNKIVIFLAGDTFAPELHLLQPRFTYSACGPFTNVCETIQKSKETGNLSYIFENELVKGCFAHDVAYSDSQDSDKRTISDRILQKNRAYEIAINPKK